MAGFPRQYPRKSCDVPGPLSIEPVAVRIDHEEPIESSQAGVEESKMSKLMVVENLSLNVVMQVPSRADEASATAQEQTS